MRADTPALDAGGHDGGMIQAFAGAALLAFGAIALAVGALPVAAAEQIADRVWPVLVFVVAITVVARLAAEAGVFSVVAGALARLARGRIIVVWLLIVALATVSTAFLSLDTTAVLLTVVVVGLARTHRLPVEPFALATVWIAHTGSLFLPVSNLTNLLSMHALGDPSPWAFFALLAPSGAIALAVSVLLLWVLYRRELRGRFEVVVERRPDDPVLFWGAVAVVVVLLPLLVSGIEPWMPSACAAAFLTALTAWRRRTALTVALLPWQLVVFVSGLFLAVAALEAMGTQAVLTALAGTGNDAAALTRLAAVGGGAANLVNNLPAYLALEPTTVSDPLRIAALVIGVNVAPLVLPWGSVATLLWHARLREAGETVSWGRFCRRGLILVPLATAGALAPLLIHR